MSLASTPSFPIIPSSPQEGKTSDRTNMGTCFGHPMMTISVFVQHQMSARTQLLQVFTIVGWCLLLGADLLIAGNLVIFFTKQKTGFAATGDLLGRLNRLTIQNGVIVSIWTLIIIILFSALTDLTFLIFALSLSPLYLITLLSSLNSRHTTSHGINWSDDTPWMISGTGRRTTNITQSQIQVTRTVQEIEFHELEERKGPSNFGAHTSDTDGRQVHIITMGVDGKPRDDLGVDYKTSKINLRLIGDEISPHRGRDAQRLGQPEIVQFEVYDGTQSIDAIGFERHRHSTSY
ncbi:hypothetical protein DL93DRAFT_2161979 [Clavulina sp. PMI_390]|nr:hypothetical protein DL93DRAFT_2161979 [Clavulina sp. PMI_390]